MCWGLVKPGQVFLAEGISKGLEKAPITHAGGGELKWPESNGAVGQRSGGRGRVSSQTPTRKAKVAGLYPEGL